MPTIAELNWSIAASREEVRAAQARLRGLAQYAETVAAERRTQLDQLRADRLQSVRTRALAGVTAADSPWVSEMWSDWKPFPAPHADLIRVGEYLDSRSGESTEIPALVPFIGSKRSIVIQSRGPEMAAVANALIQSLTMRMATLFPQQSTFTLLDPAGNGMAFPMARHLPRVTPSSGDVRRDLDLVVTEIQRIISTYLDSATTSFEQIPDEMRLNESFRLVVAADYPNRYDLRAADVLQSISTTGPSAGVQLVIHHNLDHVLSGDDGRYALSNAHVIDLSSLGGTFGGLSTVIRPDLPPRAALQETLFSRIRSAPPIDRPIAWDDAVGLPEDEWWSIDASDIIEVPVGRHGANQPLTLWFGEHAREARPCVHGVLGAMPGAGKSTLFHTLIAGLAVRYSPAELRLFLIDGKFGVEFQQYRDLPHAEVVSLRTSPELSRSVLKELVAEMSRRNAIFTSLQINDLPDYRAKGKSHGSMPRILLIVDEYQQLFDSDRDNEASSDLLRLSQQGRSAGIHMLLASQSFDTAGMLYRANIFGNVHLRMAMMLSQADVAALTDFGPTGRRLIQATCTSVGRIVLNDRAGDDDANRPGKVAFLTDEREAELLAALSKRALSLDPSALPNRVVFNGDEQPDLLDNPLVKGLVDRPSWPTPDDLESLARQSPISGGFGAADWLSADCPLALLLGQEFNVRGHARCVIRRRPNENLCIVGDRVPERIGALVSAMVSAALQAAPRHLRLVVVDRGVPRTTWAEALSETGAALAAVGYDVEVKRTNSQAIESVQFVESEVERRLALGDEERIDEPTILLILNELDRAEGFSRIADDIGWSDSDLGVVLRSVVSKGPNVGIHVIVSAASAGALRSIMADRVVQTDVRHRVAMQMSEDDSFDFVRSSGASRLQAGGPTPVCALVFDSQHQSATKFKPYSLIPSRDTVHGPLADQVNRVCDQLASRT